MPAQPRRPGRPAVLALDLGTGRLKVGLVALDGSVLASAVARYPTHSPTADQAEQDPEDWWAAVIEAVAGLWRPPDIDVVAIAVVGQGPTCVAVDAAGRATRRAITWQDRRNVDEAATLAAAARRPPWRLGILPAALWVERNEPAVAARTVGYLAAWEWLTLRLTGRSAATASAGDEPPDPSVGAALGLPPAKLPSVVPSGSVVGGLGDDVAAATGLEPGIPVVAGLNDAYASALGAGLLDPGDAIDTGGRSGGFAVYTAGEPDVQGAWIAPAPLPGRWLVGGAMAATGAALDWLAADILHEPGSIDRLLDEAAAVPAGSDGLVFLPYLAGERSPIWDPAARGAFVGLTVAHGRGHLVRAVLEAAAYAIRHVAEPIRAAGIEPTELRVCGGNARSALWSRIKADVLGVPVGVPAVPDTAMLGAAVLGACGAGEMPDLESGIRAMVRIGSRIEPDPAERSVHDARYAVYRELYPALRESMHALGRPFGARLPTPQPSAPHPSSPGSGRSDDA